MTIPFKCRTAMALVAMGLSLSAWAAGGHDGHAHDHGQPDSAIGQAGAAENVTRTVSMVMRDAMRFTPSTLKVRQGETVRFVIVNQGKIRHEWRLDTLKALKEHLALMKKFPDMEHDEPHSITLDPGKQGEIVWQFTHAGTVHFACLMPGHYEAGMRGAVQVVKK